MDERVVLLHPMAANSKYWLPTQAPVLPNPVATFRDALEEAFHRPPITPDYGQQLPTMPLPVFKPANPSDPPTVYNPSNCAETLRRLSESFAAPNLDKWANEVVAPLDSAGYDFHLVGHSLGAELAAYIASRDNHVLSLTLINGFAWSTPFIRLDQLHARFLYDAVPPANSVFMGALGRNGFALLASTEFVARYEEYMLMYMGSPMAGSDVAKYHSWVVSGMNLRPYLKDIEVPTLIVDGDQDRYAQIGTPQFQSEISPDLLETYSFENVGHLVPQERPRELANLVIGHIEGRRIADIDIGVAA